MKGSMQEWASPAPATDLHGIPGGFLSGRSKPKVAQTMKTTDSRMIHSPLAVAMLALGGALPAQTIPGRYIAVLKAG